MATVMRNMTMGQNFNMMQNNCVIVTSNNKSSVMPSQVMSSNHHYHHGKRPIAPAIEPRTATASSVLMNKNLSIDSSKCGGKAKKYNYGAAANMPYTPAQTPSVARRNARERNRVKLVNNGFANLRQHIPPAIATTVQSSSRSSSSGASKKLSKVDTLRLAVEYIRGLQQLLDDNENDPTRTMVNCSQGSSLSSTSSNSSYYSVASPNNHQLACSEPSSSPTPSYASEGSLGTVTYNSQPAAHFKSEPYDHYAEPSSSPTPSYQSDVSNGHQQQYHHHHHHHHHPHHPQEAITPTYKQESFAFTPMSSEDEDLLDAITWWQQQ